MGVISPFVIEIISSSLIPFGGQNKSLPLYLYNYSSSLKLSLPFVFDSYKKYYWNIKVKADEIINKWVNPSEWNIYDQNFKEYLQEARAYLLAWSTDPNKIKFVDGKEEIITLLLALLIPDSFQLKLLSNEVSEKWQMLFSKVITDESKTV